jgi:hypothetical protein
MKSYGKSLWKYFFVTCFYITLFWNNFLQLLQYICSWIQSLFWIHFYRNVWKLFYMLGCFEQLNSELEYEDLEINLKEWFSAVWVFYWLRSSHLCILIGFCWTVIDIVHVFVETENNKDRIGANLISSCCCFINAEYLLMFVCPVMSHVHYCQPWNVRFPPYFNCGAVLPFKSV